ncbi:MAG: imidazole glycerol phosphate synthase subunit HisF [Planctomycetaceae bacterium]|nr:imidazole glycerol phosphate synthase subunit HisF [Planctomycetaceae bacterium]
MLRSRIIPCLLVHNGGLVKTVGFKDAKYVGDPINAVKIFNEKEVDELIVVDIDASVKGREPDFRLIENLAAECRMPLCYGGGVKDEQQAEKIISLGVEKVALSSALIETPTLASRISEAIGKQSVVFVLDVKKNVFGKYSVYTHNARRNTKQDPFRLARTIESQGVGEIVINSIDKDGTMTGYDGKLVERMRATVDAPITVLGGAGSLDDIHSLIDQFKIIGAAAGSLFVFKGKYRAVLISYPGRDEKQVVAGLGPAARLAA